MPANSSSSYKQRNEGHLLNTNRRPVLSALFQRFSRVLTRHYSLEGDQQENIGVTNKLTKGRNILLASTGGRRRESSAALLHETVHKESAICWHWLLASNCCSGSNPCGCLGSLELLIYRHDSSTKVSQPCYKHRKSQLTRGCQQMGCRDQK